MRPAQLSGQHHAHRGDAQEVQRPHFPFGRGGCGPPVKEGKMAEDVRARTRQILEGLHTRRGYHARLRKLGDQLL